MSNIVAQVITSIFLRNATWISNCYCCLNERLSKRLCILCMYVSEQLLMLWLDSSESPVKKAQVIASLFTIDMS